MTVKSFSKAAEERLLDAIREVTAHVESGLSPTEAVVKVAQEDAIPFTQVPLLVQAYNVGRCTFQREHGGSGVLNKTADFPIARVEDVMSQLLPDKPVTPAEKAASEAISGEYHETPHWAKRRYEPQLREKAASAKLPPLPGTKTLEPVPGDPLIKMAKAFGQAQRIKRSVEELRHQVGVAKDRFLRGLSALRGYFKQAAATRLPFDQVRYNAGWTWGKVAEDLLDYIYHANGMTERPGDRLDKQAMFMDEAQTPYREIRACIDLAADMLAKNAAFLQTQAESREKVASVIRPFAGTPDHTTAPSRSVLGGILPASSEKQADLMSGAIGGLAGTGIQSVLQNKPTREMVNDVMLDLEDPVHTDELRQIQSRSMLSDFMVNDEVISGFAPEEVTNAYNEISQLSPRTATQPAVMRPLLRKRLTAGSVEPFEAAQMAEIEKTIRQTESPTDEEETVKTSGVLHHGILD